MPEPSKLDLSMGYWAQARTRTEEPEEFQEMVWTYSASVRAYESEIRRKHEERLRERESVKEDDDGER